MGVNTYQSLEAETDSSSFVLLQTVCLGLVWLIAFWGTEIWSCGSSWFPVCSGCRLSTYRGQGPIGGSLNPMSCTGWCPAWLIPELESCPWTILEMVCRSLESKVEDVRGKNVYMFNMNITYGIWCVAYLACLVYGKLVKWFREMWVSHLVVSWALPVCYDEIKSEMVPVYTEGWGRSCGVFYLQQDLLPPAPRRGGALSFREHALPCRCVHEWQGWSSFRPVLTSSGDFTAPVTIQASYLSLTIPFCSVDEQQWHLSASTPSTVWCRCE